MGNNTEEGKNAKNEKSQPSLNNCHVYPDWAAMQAFYGPHVAMPPYSNSPVASSSATSHYMWAPAQSMMAHYGGPYAAFYAPYAHPGVPMVNPDKSLVSPDKSSGNSDGEAMKKNKEIDSLAISLGNGSVDDDTPTEPRNSGSEATDGSSYGSNGGLARAANGKRKKSNQGSSSKDIKKEVLPVTEIVRASDKSVDGTTSDSLGKKSEDMLDVKNVKPSPSDVSQSVPSEAWLQNERELKRERRKQSNRESARRSRLRKQAETEDLANKVQALISDNMTMKSEINKMREMCKKLKQENDVLMEKRNNVQVRGTNSDFRLTPTMNLLKSSSPPLATVNLLSRVNNSDGCGDHENDDGEVYECPVKLHQLMDGGH